VKYIKLYEGYSEKLYLKISEIEYMEYATNHKKVEFLDIQINKIKDHLWQYYGDNKKYSLKRSYRVLSDKLPQSLTINKKGKYVNCNGFISAYEDEYYLIQYSFSINSRPSHTEFYKCDQFDGLLQFIDNLVRYPVSAMVGEI